MKLEKTANGGAEILIAEDSRTQAEKLRFLLEEHGYTVVTAANGREALTAIRRRKPSLIISDVMMPELDGYGLCRSVKADEKLKEIPIVLVTSLSDPQDVIKGLECGADNFVRKPYDERYLLSRINHLLTNLDLRKGQNIQLGMEIELGGRRHFITAARQQILDLLISTYEQAVQLNDELKLRESEQARSNQVLQGLYRIAEGLNQAVNEREVAELALERALELPGVQAGWIFLREGASGFRLAAARNLPSALGHPGALEGECLCRRRLISGELDSVTNIVECERLEKAQGDKRGLRFHASVPLWLGDRTLGLMNLAGPEEGLFEEEALKVLYGVGNQVAVALERARLHEHLEKLVDERTAALRESEEQLRSIAENLPGAIFRRVLKKDGAVAYPYVSSNVRTLFGLGPDVALENGTAIMEAIHADDRAAYVEALRHSADRLSAMEVDVRVALPQGGLRWMRTLSRPHRLENGDIQWDGIALDITALKEAEARRDYLVYHDPLTGLPNRALFSDRLAQALERGARFETVTAVIALELVSLKDVRDSAGFGAGDAAIRETARRLQETTQGGDTVAHAGGGEFLAALTGIGRDGDLTAPIRRIMRWFEAPFALDGREFPLKVALGIGVGPGDGEKPEILLRNAATALHQAKADPARQYHFYRAKMTERAVQRMSTESELRRALERDELVLFYQPIVETRTLRIVGAEALMRWRHPERGLVPPGQFIGIAEETGLIVPLGEFALRRAAMDARNWATNGTADVPVSVNLSGWQLLKEDLGDRILAVLEETGLPPTSLKLELTESTILRNVEAATRTMEQLAAAGVRFAVDDFGIEHSALSHLSRLPIETLKVDYAFVSRMTEDSAHAALVQAIVSMTHGMGKVAVAEGVETREQLTYLQAYQCDALQGFLFSKAVPIEAFQALLARRVLTAGAVSQ